MWRSYLGTALWIVPLTAILAIALYLPLRIAYKKKHALYTSKAREVCLCLLVTYVAAGLVLLCMPGSLYLASPMGLARLRVQTGEGINLVPFFTLRAVWEGKNPGDILNLVTNVLLFAPLGFLLPYLFPRPRQWYKTIPLALTVSAGAEAVQLFIGRSVDVDDVLLNTLGAALGYGIWRALRPVLKQ